MSASKILVRAGAVVAAGGFVLGLSAIPAGSQELEPITISGTFECVNEGGEYAWAVDYTIHSELEEPVIVESTPAAANDVIIDSAAVSGVADGTVEFDPTTIPTGGDSFASGFVDGTASGVLTLTVEWNVPDFQAEGTTTYDLTLDGTCVAPATTSTSAAPAVQAVAVTPAFTG